MESLAKTFAFILLFFFAMGLYTGLSPGFFTRMGKRQAEKNTMELKRQVQNLTEENTRLEKLHEEASQIAVVERKQRQRAEQQANESEQAAKSARQQLKDSVEVLFAKRKELEIANTARLALQKACKIEREAKEVLGDSLIRANDTIGMLVAEINALKPLAADTARARQEVQLYRAIGSILLIISMLGVTIDYWRKNRSQGGRAPFPSPVDTLPDDSLIKRRNREDAIKRRFSSEYDVSSFQNSVGAPFRHS